MHSLQFFVSMVKLKIPRLVFKSRGKKEKEKEKKKTSLQHNLAFKYGF